MCVLIYKLEQLKVFVQMGKLKSHWGEREDSPKEI